MSNKSLWWLSFVKEEEGCVGICIVESLVLEDPDDEFIIAVRRSHQHKINPGGHCKGTRIPEDLWPRLQPHLNKLFTKEEATTLFDADTEENLKKEEVDSSNAN